MKRKDTAYTVNREQYWITEEEKQIILKYRESEEDIRKAVCKILDVVNENR